MNAQVQRIRVLLLLTCLAGAFGCDDAGGGPSEETPECLEGALGCACAAGDACSVNALGDPLLCREGICVAPTCPPGGTGCVCLGGTLCSEPGDVCQEGACHPEGCQAGTRDCGCVGGTCGAGLFCDRGLGGGTCVDDAGHPGGECLASGLCHGENRCDPNTNVCVFCEPGSQGCVPTADGLCNSGLVIAASRCLSLNEVRPADPQCFTRCRGDALTADGVVQCDADGFIEGCLEGFECVDGSCVEPGGEPRVCASDVDCPDFQACLHNGTDRRCYSNCDSAQDCPMGLTCSRHVCRIPCAHATSESDECPAGSFCQSLDGTAGVCVELSSDEDAAPAPEVTGQLSLTTDRLRLSSPAIALGTRLSTDSVQDETFQLVASEHRAFSASGELLEEVRASDGGQPLGFVTVRVDGALADLSGSGVSITVPPACGSDCPVVQVQADGEVPDAWARFEGQYVFTHPVLGDRRLHVSYAAGASGRWNGTMYYFGSFPDIGLGDFIAAESDARPAAATSVRNGLIQAWGAFRRHGLQGGGLPELRAILTATHSESWRRASVAEACLAFSQLPGAAFQGACYLYDGAAGGLRFYTDNLSDAPIPTGAVDYPIAIALEPAPTAQAPFRLAGVIESEVALHYAGTPAIEVDFAWPAGDVSACEADGVPGACVVPLTGLRADISVGGRAPANADAPCGNDGVLAEYPWLVSAFTTDTVFDPATGQHLRQECRDQRFPHVGDAALNASLTGGNPVPDGHAIHRRLRLVDGAVIDQDTLFALFEEEFITAGQPNGHRVYGYMVLDRNTRALEPGEVPDRAFAPQTDLPPPADDVTRAAAGPACDPELTFAALGQSFHGRPFAEREALADDLARALISGLPAGLDPGAADTYAHEEIYYLCVDTGRFYGGPAGVGAGGVVPECPFESTVRYFAISDPSITPSNVLEHACQDDGSCGAVLDSMADRVDPLVHLEPVWTCEDGSTYCAADRSDLRAGKIFYAPSEGAAQALFPPLRALVQEAFRYRTRFASDDGSQLGFAPTACEGLGYSTPYCYDPDVLAEIIERTDCLLRLYLDYADPAGASVWTELRAHLSESLGAPGLGHVGPLGDGFERLYAELLVVLGDEAHAQALRSRFDLAASNGAAFVGSAFEEGGVDLSGVAGFEMRSLYEAVQYFQLVTDRFYRVTAPVLEAASAPPSEGGRGDVGEAGVATVSQEVVTRYLQRVIGASTKKARAWSEIALRYQGIARTDLARRVIERAYTTAYLESSLLSRIMLRIADRVSASERDQVVAEVEHAQRGYRVALNEMREVYASLDAELNAFGFAPDFIPLPGVDEADTRFNNAFEVVLGVARRRADTARRFEDEAIQSNRSFETDEATFQSELVRIALTHEQRLNNICGVFEGDDGRVYPAIRKYASFSSATSFFEDPCGLVGNGEIHNQLIRLAEMGGDYEIMQTRMEHVLQRIDGESRRVAERCDLSQEIADFQYESDQEIVDLEQRARDLRTAVSGIDRTVNTMIGVTQILQQNSDCELNPFTCAAKSAVSLPGLAAAALVGATVALEDQAAEREHEADLERIETAHWVASQQCRELTIESEPVMRDLWRQLEEQRLEARQFQHRFALLLADLERFRLEAQRIQEEQQEAEELAIDVERARNDPNIRVYRNAAVINADESFRRALAYAYRATRMYEYFTSQSYARAEELYLIRMVSHGLHNIDTYLDQLEDDYEDFRVTFRTKATRVERLSVANDILQVPLREDGVELDTNTRRRMFFERLTAPENLDANGAWNIPFSTSFERVSPCTFNHQISYIEVRFEGTGFGDDEADLLIFQEGTGVIQTVNEGMRFHRMEPALIVANPYFNRARTVFDPAVYRRSEMRERPLVNTNWRLVFDQHNNVENQDIDLTKIEDIILYIYYTDFTDPSACSR